MKTLRRTIHPHVRVLDEKLGLVEYVASDETLDSYQEVIKADGWRFDEFSKNAPFVDSHIYDSIESLLGAVTDFRVEKKQLVEVVKWAIDVPSNLLAQRGFAMTAAGYLKAVSVGFVPVRSVDRWGSDKSGWLAALAAVGLKEESGVRCIYLEQQQKELSACVIGANPNAVARACRDGIFRDSDVDAFRLPFPELARTLEKAFEPVRARTFSFATPSPSDTQPPEPMSQNSFLDQFDRLTNKTKSAFGQIETARRSPNPGDLALAIHRLSLCLADERRMANGDPENRYAADPEVRAVWGALARKLGRAQLSPAEQEVLKSLDPSSTLGTGLIPESVAQQALNVALDYGVFAQLGVQPLASSKVKAAKITAIPDAVFIMPSATGASRAPTADTSLAGAATTGECNSVACLIEPSAEWLQDSKLDPGVVLLLMVGQAIAKRLDYGCFAADGTSDTTNGGQTGIFQHGTVPSVSAVNGNTSIAALQQADFMRAVGAVSAAALQRPCGWFVSPTFLPDLMLLKDGANYLVKSPAETGGDWQLTRFPMWLTAAAPSANTVGSKVAAFGRGASYLVAMRQELELMTGVPKWNQAIVSFRAVVRARCEMQNAADFATLKLAAL